MLTVPSEVRSAAEFDVPKLAAIDVRSTMLITPSWLMSGVFETPKLVDVVEPLVTLLLIARVVGKVGTSRTKRAPLFALNDRSMGMVRENMVWPDVSLTTVIVIDPESVWAVVSTVIVPETVTVRLSNVKDLLNVVVWLEACAIGASPTRASSANTRIGAFIFHCFCFRKASVI